MDNSQLLSILTWGLGVCVTGFLFLVGWIIKINIELQKRVPYEWIEGTFKAEIKADFLSLEKSFKEVKDAIVGTVDKSGVITKLHDHEKRLEELEEV